MRQPQSHYLSILAIMAKAVTDVTNKHDYNKHHNSKKLQTNKNKYTKIQTEATENRPIDTCRQAGAT